MLKSTLLRGLAKAIQWAKLRGSDRVLRKIYNPGKRTHDSIQTIIPYHHGLRLHVDTASYLEWSTFFYGYYEPEIVALIDLLVEEDSTFIDIGANIGLHTLAAARAASRGTVISFEPQPKVFARLESNVQLNKLTNVTLYNAAVSDTNGTSEFFIPRSSPENLGTASLVEMGDAERVVVETKTLESALAGHAPNRVVMKIDVEGAELHVIKAALPVIEHLRPIVIYEYDRTSWSRAGATLADVSEIFTRLGYRQFLVKSSRFYSPKPKLAEFTANPSLDGNILAIPEEIRQAVSPLLV